MQRKTIFTLVCLGHVLLAGNSSAQQNTALDAQYNEEAINQFLAQLDPAVGYTFRLKMMKGHLRASLYTLAKNNVDEAREHVAHPRTEILTELTAELSQRNFTSLDPALAKAEKALHGGDKAAAEAAINEALAVITDAEHKESKTESIVEITPDVISALLRVAVVEYHEAFEYQALKNIVEYHDGAFFVREAKLMLEDIAPSLKAKNTVAYDKMMLALESLYKAWPEDAVPNGAVLPVTKMQSLVTIAELQLNRLR